jgi:hypothetical protein
MPLRTPLENGDQVEILVSKAQHPQPGWLSFVVTGKARAKIRRFVKSKEREETVALGRKIFDEIVQRLPAPLGWEAIAEALETAPSPRRRRADGGDRAQADKRRGRDGGADAGSTGIQRVKPPPAAHRNLDQGPDARESPFPSSPPAAHRSPGDRHPVGLPAKARILKVHMIGCGKPGKRGSTAGLGSDLRPGATKSDGGAAQFGAFIRTSRQPCLR